MGIIFNEEWNYAVGTVIPVFPSTLGGFFKVGVFGAAVTDQDYFWGASGKSLKYDVSGGIGWQNAITSYSGGMFHLAFKGGNDTGGFFNGLELFDAAIPATAPFPQPIQLMRLTWEADNTLTMRGPDNSRLANSGKSVTTTSPLGTLTTIPFAVQPVTWYYLQCNVSFSTSIAHTIVLSMCVHINSKPVLAYNDDTGISVNILPHGDPPTFNRLNLFSAKNNFSYLDNFLFDDDPSIPPFDGLPASYATLTQGVVEPLVLPLDTENYARITQGVIEIKSLPDNYARVTQAVIEILAERGINPSGGWKVREA